MSIQLGNYLGVVAFQTPTWEPRYRSSGMITHSYSPYLVWMQIIRGDNKSSWRLWSITNSLFEWCRVAIHGICTKTSNIYYLLFSISAETKIGQQKLAKLHRNSEFKFETKTQAFSTETTWSASHEHIIQFGANWGSGKQKHASSRFECRWKM